MDIVPRNEAEQKVVDDFRYLYWANPEQTWRTTRWQGVLCRKAPTDLWIYQEIIGTHRPETIVETGTFAGGSALFMAHMMDIAGIDGQVISVDIQHPFPLPQHPKIKYIEGGSTDRATFKKVREMVKGDTMVVLDSDHFWSHVWTEMNLYGELVTDNQYMIVEDTNIELSSNYRGVGPKRAVDQYLELYHDFEVVENCERLLLTQNPGGFLLKKESN